ncbi:MAG TPA: DsbA family protein [Xanthobacteraceae bacterium]|nr:DsbA family protein [Xanthobacteraceae bacterium]
MSAQIIARAAPAVREISGAKVVEVTHFSDVLCVWAYISEVRIDALKRKFGGSLQLKYQFCSVFGDTARKIKSAWKDKGEYEGFNSHLRHVAEKFPHIEVHPEIWLKTRPPSSASPHLFLKAVQQWEQESGKPAGGANVFERVTSALRRAFFRDCKDISRWNVQCAIAQSLGVDIDAIERLIHSGAAFARLAADYQDAEKMRIEGSPSLVLNEGRQKLYGNVGFRVIEANIEELIREPRPDDASWC